jgi:hypothetical protein
MIGTVWVFASPSRRICVRLLNKNRGRQMHVNVVREELETLGICVQEVLELRSGYHDQEGSKTRPLTPNLAVALEPEVANCFFWRRSAARESRRKTTSSRKSIQGKRCQPLGHTQQYAVTYLGVLFVARSPPESASPQHQLTCCSCGGNHTAKYA